jgi:glucose/arabinose dehydrogenase
MLALPLRALRLVTIVGLPLAALPANAQQNLDSSAGPLRVETLARGLQNPWGLAVLPDGRYLVTERPGRLRIVAADGALSPPVANVPTVFASGQGGLLGLALDPAFATNRTIFFSYAEPGDGGAGTAVARARLVEGAAPRLDEVTVIFRENRKSQGGRHFGSRLVFAPDGTLFVTLGDRGDPPRSQNLADHAAKIVRITRDGAAAPGNPFAGRADARPEIFSYGHRNMQAATLDAQGRLWVVDHGARGGDEVNRVQAGRNYGWPVISYGREYSGFSIGEGTAKAGMEQPLFYWDPSIAPSGATFYSGKLIPAWRGNLLVGALRGALVSRVTVEGDRVQEAERLNLRARIRDVVEAPDGAILLLTDEGDGRILRLTPAR